MFVSETPENIEDIAVDQVYKLVHDNPDLGLPSPKNRLKVIRVLFEVLNFDLSSDLALVLCTEPKALLVLATAGGGKTTAAQIKAICIKLWGKSKSTGKPIKGDKILSLVYNKHNVLPMQNKHAALVNRLKISGIKGLDIDSTINASTMHSFCDQIRSEFVAKMQLIGFSLLSMSEAEHLMETILIGVARKHSLKNFYAKADDLVALYNYAKESMVELNDLKNTDKFVDLGLDISMIAEIFELYDKMKKAKKKYDFTDMLTKVYIHLRDNPEDLKRVQKYYDYIIADEIQDFTPIMMSILQLFVSDGTPLMCIGDEDQGIYNFRGADIYNTLHFNEKFVDGHTYTLSRNRRCAASILSLAKNVINSNTLRFQKKLSGVRPGGKVEYIPYASTEGENRKVVAQVAAMSEEDLYDSVICYRERNNSIILTELLESARIPYYVISGAEAFSHPLYKDIFSVLDALESPYDKKCIMNLYKVLPITKEQMYMAVGYSTKTHKFSNDDKVHFARLDYGNAVSRAGFADSLEKLSAISRKMSSCDMSEYFPELFSMLCKYHWLFLRKSRENLEVYDNFVEEKIKELFNVSATYQKVFENFTQRKDICRRNQKSKAGIAVSTFHSLKGLEFKNVIIMDMDNSNYPNYALIESKGYPADVEKALKECETRLYYVAVTRAKDSLTIYYNESNPSCYVSNYMQIDKTMDAPVISGIDTKKLQNMDLFESDDEFIPQIDIDAENNVDDLLDDSFLEYESTNDTSNMALLDYDSTSLLMSNEPEQIAMNAQSSQENFVSKLLKKL